MARPTGFLERQLRERGESFRYGVFVPGAYEPSRPCPTILFLHGAGERGADGRKPLEAGLGPAIRKRADAFPFLTIFPQCTDLKTPPSNGWLSEGADARRALVILGLVESEFVTDKDRTYLSGLSMGGFGAWNMAAADPNRWAAVVPICGGGDPAWATRLVKLPIWCFHGAEDSIVPVERSREMVAAVKAAGGSPRYTEYANVGHHSWEPTYANDELYTWMLEQRRG